MNNQLASNNTIINVNLLNKQGIWVDYLFTFLVWLCAVFTGIILLWIALTIFQGAQPAIKAFGLGFFWSQDWDVEQQQFGALPLIYGTLVTCSLSLLFAVPLGLAVAITTTENFLPPWVRSPVSIMVELIASIPTVILGMWGIFVLIPAIKPLQEALYKNLSWLPVFSTEPYGPSMLVAGVLLSIMILPTVAAISRQALLAVPSDLRTAAMALGATRWETIWGYLLPMATPGIIGAVVLGLGQSLGETIAVTMVIGNSTLISPSLLAPGNTLAAILANQLPDVIEDLKSSTLEYLALILFMITLVFNSMAIVFVRLIKGNHD